MSSVANQLRDVFANVLEVSASDILDSTSPEDVSNWDSLATVILIGEIESRFSIQFDFEELLEFENFGSISNLVAKKYAGT